MTDNAEIHHLYGIEAGRNRITDDPVYMWIGDRDLAERESHEGKRVVAQSFKL